MPDASELQRLLSPQEHLTFVPVRHHSPRCAYHLQQRLNAFKPQQILIEGPQELNALLPVLQHSKAKPPLAGYLYYRASKKQDSVRSRVYVPFAEFSPEWVALRHAKAHKTSVRFIDLPFAGHINLSDTTEARYLSDQEPLLPDEPLQQAPDIIEQLIGNSTCRDFDEWWDRHFESGITPANDQEFFASLLGFSLLLRHPANTNGQTNDRENQAREQYMAEQIRQALATGQSCMVICGGFHLTGLLSRLSDCLPEDVNNILQNHQLLEEPAALELDMADAADIHAHVIPYSLKRLSNAHGYSAGIPDPGYYQQVWHSWTQHRHQNDGTHHWQAIWPNLAASLTDQLRDQGLAVTLPDAVEATRMATGLSRLRGYPGGRTEILEPLQTTLIRDDNELPLWHRTLRATLAPSYLGTLPDNASLSSLEQDMLAFCQQFRLPDRPVIDVQKDLDIYRHERHRQMSQGLHRLTFLQVPYGKREYGPDFVAGSQLQRVRERWQLSWSIETRTSLIELSRYGDTLADAASHKLLEDLNQSRQSPAPLVLQTLVMGLDNVAQPVLDAVEHWLAQSLDAIGLAQSCCRLAQAYEAHQVLGGNQQSNLLPLLQRAWQQTCLHLPSCGQLDPEQHQEMLDALADLYGMANRMAPWADQLLLLEACETLQQRDVAPGIQGIATAILAMSGHWRPEQIEAALADQLGLCLIDASRMGEYLQGFLRLASVWLINHPPTLIRLTRLIRRWSEDEFLFGLPALRLAFSQLNHLQLAQLAEALAGQLSTSELPDFSDPDAAQKQHSQALYQQTRTLMQEWGILP